MRVLILSGNEAGQIQEVSEAQGEHMLAFGFAERAPDAGPAVEHPEPGPEASLQTGRRDDVVNKEFDTYMDHGGPPAAGDQPDPEHPV